MTTQSVDYKTKVILDVLRRQVDKDYGWSTPPLMHDLDVFFLDDLGMTQPLAVLDNPIWPPIYEACQLRAFPELFTIPTIVSFSRMNSMYMEYPHGYRLTHIVSQFAKALMHFNEEIVDNKEEDDDDSDKEIEYVLNEPDDVEKAIYSFAYFLASLTGKADANLVARFSMQLSQFKRCEPNFTPFALPKVSDIPLIGKQIIDWLLTKGDTPSEDLVYHICWQGEQGDNVDLNTLDKVTAKLAEDSTRVFVKNVTVVNWATMVTQGIRLSEMMTTPYLSFPMANGEKYYYNHALIGLVAYGLSKDALYQLFDHHVIERHHRLATTLDLY